MTEKETIIKDILDIHAKVCFNQNIDENADYRMGLKVGAEIMYDRIKAIESIKSTTKNL